MNEISLRPVTEDDMPFFYSALMRSCKHSSFNFRVPSSTFFAEYKRLLERLLTKDRSEIVIACLKDEPEVILGFIFYNKAAVHYVYVKPSFRLFGIAKMLIGYAVPHSSFPFTASHWSDDLTEIVNKDSSKQNSFVYNPYVLME